tara:strand:+ start:5126 stop:5401 length:276 start_codon:yes stop_codon:yes gene_type:complete
MELSPEHIKPFVICAVSTWGVVEALKPLIKRFAVSAWSKSTVRISALAVGAGFGFALDSSVNGALVGLCGAALSATVVGVVKGRVKSVKPD